MLLSFCIHLKQVLFQLKFLKNGIYFRLNLNFKQWSAQLADHITKNNEILGKQNLIVLVLIPSNLAICLILNSQFLYPQI